MKVHHLKCHPEHFERTWLDEKRAEIRLNDRDYQVGDLLHMTEWVPEEERFTVREVVARVQHMTDFGCKPGFIVLFHTQAHQVWWRSNGKLQTERIQGDS